MSLLRERREQEYARRAALVAQSLAGGRSGIPALMQNTRQGGKGRAQAFMAPDSAASTSPGETITVSRASQSIASAGTLIEWDTVRTFPKAAGGIASTTVPTDTLTQTLSDSYYVLALEFKWDTYEGGGTVVVTQGGDVVGTVTATAGDHFVREFRLGHNVTAKPVQVTVSHTSVSSQTMVNAQATLEKVDVVAPTVEPDPLGLETLGGTGAQGSSTGTASATIAPPTTTALNDLMVFVAAGASAAPGDYGTWTPPSGVTELHRFAYVDGIGGGGNGVEVGVYWRRATADDVAGTTTYTSQLTGTAVQYATVTCNLIRAASLVGAANPFGGALRTHASASGTGSNKTLAAVAPGGTRTLGLAFAVRNQSTTGVGTNYVQSWTTPLVKFSMFAPSTYGGFGYQSALSGVSRRGGFASIATSTEDTGVTVTYGNEYTHQYLVLAGLA